MPSGKGGYMESNEYTPSEGSMSGGNAEVMSGNVVVQEFPTTTMDGQANVMQRPIIDSSMMTSGDDGSVITIPGPETGPHAEWLIVVAADLFGRRGH